MGPAPGPCTRGSSWGSHARPAPHLTHSCTSQNTQWAHETEKSAARSHEGKLTSACRRVVARLVGREDGGRSQRQERPSDRPQRRGAGKKSRQISNSGKVQETYKSKDVSVWSCSLCCDRILATTPKFSIKLHYKHLLCDGYFRGIKAGTKWQAQETRQKWDRE